jgi:LuxR family maltose regulon positive regulatory protein
LTLTSRPLFSTQPNLKVFEFAALNFQIRSVHVFGALSDLESRQGRLHESARYWTKAVTAIEERQTWGHLPLSVIGWVHARMGEVFYEWNNLAEAWNLLSKGLERAELGGDIRKLLAGSVLTARLKLTEGSAALASEYLGRACSLIEDAMFPEWASRVERCQLEIWLAQDRLDAAVAWVDAISSDPQRALRLETELTELAIARVLTAKGNVPSIKRWYAWTN